MKAQDKTAEINLSEKYFEDGSWTDSDTNLKARAKQLEMLKPILPGNQLILDAGCGPGNYGIMLAAENDVIGVDISSQMTAMANERADKNKVRFRAIVGDLEHLPFTDNYFDLCFCGFTLHHFPDINVALEELVRVTKNNGRIVAIEPNGSNPGVKFSSIMERIVNKQLANRGLDTPNESIHGRKYYIKAFEQRGLADIQVIPHYFGGLPPLPSKSEDSSLFQSAIRTVIYMRRLFYLLLAKILPRPINGADLMIIARKNT